MVLPSIIMAKYKSLSHNSPAPVKKVEAPAVRAWQCLIKNSNVFNVNLSLTKPSKKADRILTPIYIFDGREKIPRFYIIIITCQLCDVYRTG